LWEPRELPDLKGLLERLDHLDQQVHKAVQDLAELLEARVPRDHWAARDKLELQDLQDLRVPVVLPERLEQLVVLETLDRQDLQEVLDLRGVQDQLE